MKKKTLLFGVMILLAMSIFFIAVWELPQQTQKEIDEKDTSLLDQKKAPRREKYTPGSKSKEKISPRKSDLTVFKSFQLSPSELEIFYSRRYEPRKVTLEVEGLKINQKPFQVDRVQDLPESVVIPLPGGLFKEFHRHFVNFEDEGSFVWVGVSPSDERETIHLSSYNHIVVGQIEVKEGSYEIKYLLGDKNVIRRVDTSYFLEDFNDAVIIKNKVSRQIPEEDLQVAVDTSRQITVDIIVGYSQLIETEEGGQNAALALINLHIGMANTAFRNSLTGIMLGVTAIKRLDMGATPKSLESHFTTLRNSFGKSADPDYDATNPYHVFMAARESTGADLATLLLAGSDIAGVGSCGRASVFHNGFSASNFREFRSISMSVVRMGCSLSLAHEIGHNLGCHHDRDNVSDEHKNVILPYAFGFISSASDFRTVMSYSKGGCCPRVMYFSNPDLTIRSVAIGRVGKEDNSRVIRERADLVSRLYDTATGHNNKVFPRIITQPVGGFVPEGGSFQLKVGVSGSPNLQTYYQWYELDSNNQQTTLDKASTQIVTGLPGSSKTYYVVAWNRNGLVVSNSVTVNFLKGLRIVEDLEDLQLDFGELAEFSLQVIGYPTPSVTWYKDGQELDSSSISGLHLGPARWFHQGRYWAVISHVGGKVETNRVNLRLNSKWDVNRDRSPAQVPELGDINCDLGIREEENP